MGEPAYQLPEEDQPDIRPDLRSLEGGGGSTPRAGEQSTAPKPEESEGGSDADSTSPGNHLRSAESGANKGSSSDSGLFNKEGDAPGRLGGMRGAMGRLRGRRDQLFKSVGKHKWLYGLGGGALVSAVGFIFMIFLLLAALKIPHLAENIASYQFARVFQQAAETNERVTSEKIAVDAADQGIYGKLKAKYDATGSKVSEQWSKLDKYQPNKVISNMDETDTLKFNYKQTAWGGQKIAGITMGNTTALVRSKTLPQKLIPSYDFVKGLGSDNINLVQQYQTALKDGFRAQEVGPITRGLVAKEIRARLGISLTAWAIAKYKNLSEQKAALQEARDAHARINTPDPEEPTTASLKDAKDKVQAAEEKGIASDTELPKIIANGGRDTNVEQVMADSVKTSGFDTALGVVNPAYAIATPACIVFDGSLDHSGSTIDANVDAQIKEYSYVASAADQQKDGTNATENAVGALNNRLGDYSDSAPIQRATNNSSYVPPTSPSAEASSMGTFTILSALLGGGKTVDVVNKMAGNICPALTNIYAASGVAIANIILTIFTLGGSEGAEQTVLQTVRFGVEKAADKVIESVTTKAGAKLTAGKTASFLGDSLKTGAKIAGATLAAKAIVLSKSGYANNGIDTSNDTANNADAGGNLMAQEVDREQFYGRPLDKAETNSAANQSMQLAYDQNQSKSAYQRYIALSNYNSLLTRVGMAMMGSMHHFSVSNFVGSLGERMGSPLSFLGGAILGTNHSMAFAANSYNSDLLNHGNVQFGWSAAETALMKQPDYSMLENQLQLDASGQEDAIASTYGKCFEGSTTIGTLLQDPDNGITRDENGNVDDNKGTCAPRNLGPDDNGNFKNTTAKLVFRYRLAQRDSKGLDTVLDEQTITEDSSTATTGGSFTVASYNMCQETNHNCPHESTKVDLISSFIAGNSNRQPFDIIGAQELSQPTQAALMNKLSGYDTFPKQVPADQGRAIIWNTATFTMKDSGRLAGIYSNDGSLINDPSNPYAFPWVKLATSDGQIVYAISLQSPNDDHGDKDGSKRKANAQAVLAWAKQRASGNDAVIVTGDFNTSGTRFGAASSYCVLTTGGTLQHAHDMQDQHSTSKACPTPDPVHYAPLDSIYASTNASLTAKDWNWMGEQSVNSGTTGTDHSPSYVTYTYPGLNSGAGTTFKLVTFNIFHSAQQPDSFWQHRMDLSVATLKSNQVTVAGLQEARANQQNYFRKTTVAGDTYDIYPASSNGSSFTPNPIIWDKSRFTLISGSRHPIRYGQYGTLNDLVVVKLRDNTTQQQIIVMNTHDPADVVSTSATQGQQDRFYDANSHVDLISQLKKQGLPIFLTGDFNNRYSIISLASNAPLGNIRKNLTYCIVTRNGDMQDSYDAAQNKNGECPSTSAGPAGNSIDHIFVSNDPDVNVTDFSVIAHRGVKNNGSDTHDTIAADITIKSATNGGATSGDARSNGWQWPLTKADYNGLSQCFFKPTIRGDTVIKAGHTGIDLRASVGTPVYAAHDGTVIKTDPAGTSDGGKYIIIKNGSGIYSNYQHNSQILVHQGQQVKAGDKISISGNTGFTTGPHVHFSITTQPGLDSRNSVAYSVDPIPYLPSDRDTGSCQ
jgi:endonuclease/exonuclease/phosphatase family metal-dependent hydrolase